MKNIIFLTSLVVTLWSFSQEKTYTMAELDSISKTEALLEQSFPNSKEKDSSNFKIIERFPIYKGCEDLEDNRQQKNCMSNKIGELFKNNFNTTLPKDSEIPEGRKRIFINFKVDSKGNVIDGKARSSYKYLDQEALRVLQLIPKFTPGYFKNEPVTVPFSLPLMVVVEKENQDNFTFPVYRGCQTEITNEELKKCSIEKIKNYIKMSFDLDIANAVMPLEKSTQFQVDFIINKKGRVEQVTAKANHRAIAIEAIKVTKRLPRFKKPGTKHGKPVDTPYSLLMTIYF